jgi:hypothetical protein
MKRKIKITLFIIIGLLILLAIWAGPPLWREYQENKPVTYEKTENYKIQETPEGRIIENKNAGFSFSVPEGWNIEYTDTITWSAGVNEFGVILETPEIEYNPNSHFIPVPMKGCIINVYVSYNNRNEYDFTSAVIEYNSSPEEITNVSNYPAVYYVYGSIEELEESPFNFISKELKVPVRGALYNFETYISSEDRDYCQSKWEEFIENIVIK